MKKIFQYIAVSTLALLIFASCEDYLDRAPVASLSDNDIFGKYESFQGFEDQLFLYLFDPISINQGGGLWLADETHSSASQSSSYMSANGDYWQLLSGPNALAHFSMFLNSRQTGAGIATGKISQYSGFWYSSWKSIRIANIALDNLDILDKAQLATTEQRNLLEGQALFFRAYNHFVLMQMWGGLPYIDTVLTAEMDINYPRLPLKQGVQRCVDDFVKAATLLPASWDATAVGASVPGKNAGRPTKASAYGFAAKALLFMASPLNNPGYQYDAALAKKSAEMGWEVLKLADQGYCGLQRITEDNGDPGVDDYKRNFVAYPEAENIYTKENLLARSYDKIYAEGNFTAFYQSLQKLFFPKSSGGIAVASAPSQNLVDRFETVNGKLPEDDPTYNPLKPWDNRDPRFYNVILTDNTPMTPQYNVVTYAYDANGNPARDFGSGQTETGYYIKKWWIYGCTNATGGTRIPVTIGTPLLRLAEVYLNYAEALIAADNTPQQAPELNGETAISAYDAVDKLRARIYTKTNQRILPPLNMTLYGGPGKDGTVKGSFMQKIWDERSVELCFEMTRWIDLRRWHVAHLDMYKNVYGMRFNQAKTSFEKVLLVKRVFENRHYWLPIPRTQLGLYQEYTQNPGW